MELIEDLPEKQNDVSGVIIFSIKKKKRETGWGNERGKSLGINQSGGQISILLLSTCVTIRISLSAKYVRLYMLKFPRVCILMSMCVNPYA